MKKGNLKKETEGTILAALDQALRTNAIKNVIEKQNISPLCRMCGKWEEAIAHIVAECPKLAQKQYKAWRHDKVAQVIHWKLCKKWDVNELRSGMITSRRGWWKRIRFLTIPNRTGDPV